MSNGAHRNGWITWGYFELAERMRPVVGDRDVPWPLFAAWSSKAVGRAIGATGPQDLVDQVTGRLHDPEGDLVRSLSRVTRLPGVGSLAAGLAAPNGFAARVVARAGGAFADGNRRIFSSVAPTLLALVEAVERGARPDVALARQLSDEGGFGVLHGQRGFELRRALDVYCCAARANGRADRSRLVADANLWVAVHEQRRVQDALDDAFGAAVDELDAELRKQWARVRPGIRGLALRALRDDLFTVDRAVRGAWAELLTRHAVSVPMPAADVIVAAPPPVGDGVRPLLVDDPGLDTGFRRMLRLYGLRSGAPPRGAADWTALPDRLRFIDDLMCGYQLEPSLRQPPWDRDQLAALAAGRAPER